MTDYVEASSLPAPHFPCMISPSFYCRHPPNPSSTHDRVLLDVDYEHGVDYATFMRQNSDPQNNSKVNPMYGAR